MGIFFDAAIYSTAIRLRCRLFIVPSGHGSPCLDLRRVSSEVVDAAMGTDLGGTDAAPHRPCFTCMRLTSQSYVAPPAVVIEGMGRSVHTNWTALFKVGDSREYGRAAETRICRCCLPCTVAA